MGATVDKSGEAVDGFLFKVKSEIDDDVSYEDACPDV